MLAMFKPAHHQLKLPLKHYTFSVESEELQDISAIYIVIKLARDESKATDTHGEVKKSKMYL